MDIAIIGMGGIFPQAANVEQYYFNLAKGIDSIRRFSYSRISNTGNAFVEYLPYGYLENIDQFDYAFFGLSLSEAQKMDPNQRLLLQVVYEIFENAGLRISELAGSQTSVFVADKQNHYHKLFSEIDSISIIGNLKSMMAGRISRFFDLRGSSLSVDTACSTSLVAVNLACQELMLGHTDQALVCASEANVTPLKINFEGLGVISKSFKCKTFSDEADGIGLGEMVGGVLLKRKDDAVRDGNTILAVIKGISVNQDAGLSSSLTAPNSISQEEVIISAWNRAKIDPSQITYIEAHGTGTKLGDPIEIKALNSAFSKFSDKVGFCAISSVKTNIGHTDAAAGMAGLIKVILSLRKKVLFPSLHFNSPNRYIQFHNSPLYVNTKFSPWESDKHTLRTAGMSSFSITGTNVHLVIQEYVKPESHSKPATRRNEATYNRLILFSAKSRKAVALYQLKLKRFLKSNSSISLDDLSYSLLANKETFSYYFAALTTGRDHLLTTLDLPSNVELAVKPDKLIIIVAYNSSINLQMISLYSRRYLSFLELSTQIFGQCPKQHQNDPRVINFVFQYCLIKLFEHQGIKTKYFLQDNFGKHICQAFQGKISVEEAFANILSITDADISINNLNLDRLREYIGNQKSLIIDLAKGYIADTLLKVKNQEDQFDVIFFNETSTEESLYEFYCKLGSKNIRLNWKDILLYPGQSIALPTYAFEPNRCWISDPSTMDLHQYIYTCSWKDCHIEIEHSNRPKRWLVFGAHDEVLVAIKEYYKESEILFVHQVSSFSKFDTVNYEADFSSEDSLNKTVDALLDPDSDTSIGVIFCVYVNPLLNERPIADLLQYQFNVTKSVARSYSKSSLSYFVITKEAFCINGTETSSSKFQQSVAHGFIASASEEHLSIKMKGIDIDALSLPLLPRLIHSELSNDLVSVAYRDGTRFVKSITDAEKTIQPKGFRLQFKGVYVITGGPMGIGLEVARWFASLEVIRIVFIGRKDLPAPDQWNELDPSHPDFQLILSLKEIETMGAEVISFAADVSDKSKLEQVILKVRGQYGPIQGVIHSAGIPGERLLAAHSWSSFYSAMLPKVDGLINLAIAIEVDQPDFFITFSSLDSIVGSPGNTNYSAANAFVDSYTYLLREKGMNAMVINWPAWKETGMWHRASLKNPGLKQISQEVISNWEGLSFFHSIVNGRHIQSIVSKESPEKYAGKWFIFSSNEPSKNLENNLMPETKAEPVVAKNDMINSEWSEMENRIGVLWMEVLKTEGLSLHDDFFDLGGHSLHAARLFNKIENSFNIRLEIDDLLEYSTIKSLSNFIESLGDKQQKRDAKENKEEVKTYPVSSTQKRMWILCQDSEVSISYNELDAYEWVGELNLDSYKKTIDIMLDRHEILRTTFKAVDDSIVQEVSRHAMSSVEFFDFSLDSLREEKVNEIFEQAVHYVFDLQNGPLCHFKVIKKASNHFVLLFNFHHIVCDGHSQKVFVSEFQSFYNAFENNLPKPITDNRTNYKDYAINQQHAIMERSYIKEQIYWRHQLAGWQTSTNLPCLQCRIGNNREAGVLSFTLLNSISSGIVDCAKRYSVTPFVVFYAGLCAFFSRCLNERTTAFGTVAEGRLDGKLDNQIGPYINTLPLLNTIEWHQTFYDILLSCKRQVAALIKNQAYPYEKILEDLRQDLQLDIQALFSILISFQDVEEGDFTLNSDLVVKKVDLPVRFAKFVLTLTLVKKGNDFNLHIIWDKAAYDEKALLGFVNNFQFMLKECLLRSEKQICEHPLIDQHELNLLNTFNSTARRVTSSGLVDMLHGQVLRQGESAALVMNDNKMTFSELWRRAGKVKDILLYNQGRRENPIIAVMMDRGFEMIISIWGILRAGLTYMPIDPSNPEARLKFLLQDSNASTILADRPNQWNLKIQYIDVVADWEAINESSQHSDIPRSSTSMTYVLYTSGSTGKPKGVIIEDAGVVNRIDWMWHHYHFKKAEAILQKTPYTFDVSVWEIFMTLCFGGKLVLCPKELIYEPLLMARLIHRHKITTVHFVPSMYTAFLSSLDDQAQTYLTTLRHVMISGEALKRATVKAHYSKLNIPLHNLYGPTEASVDVTYYETTSQDELIPIGKPISNIQVHILDQFMNRLPVGAIGNICLSGTGLARGYLNQPELTSKYFFFVPSLSTRVYSTGDLGRWLPDGNIEFIGRNDYQVKVRGNRIELGEIENVLNDHESINEAVALVIEDSNEELLLWACYSGVRVNDNELREWLKSRVPHFMIPHYFLHKQILPHTSSGKIDRQLLNIEVKAVANLGVIKEDSADVIEIESLIIQIWKQVLGEKQIGLRDSFFLLGGDSIKVIRACGIIQQQLKVMVSFQQFLDNPTVKDLAAFIHQADSINEHKLRVTDQQPHYALSPGQKRLWILDQIETDKTGYVVSSQYDINGILNVPALEMAFNDIIRKYEILRTKFEIIEGEPRQVIVSHNDGFTLKYFDLTLSDYPERIVNFEIEKTFNDAFDLSSPILLKVLLAKLRDEEYRMVVMLHHIVCDAWSINILTGELVNFYNRHTSNVSNDIRESIGIQYKDFAEWLSSKVNGDQLKGERDFWINKLSGDLPVIRLPYDLNRSFERKYTGNKKTLSLDQEIVKTLGDLSLQNNATLFVALFTVVNTFLYKYTGQEDIIIGVPVANRDLFQADDQIGFFVNTLPIRCLLKSNGSFLENFTIVKRSLLEAYENQHYPFNEMVEIIKTQRNRSRNPLFDVTVSIEDDNLGSLSGMNGVSVQKRDDDFSVSQFDLSFDFIKKESGNIDVNIHYSTDLFEESTVQRLAANLGHWFRITLERNDLPISTLPWLCDLEINQLKSFNKRVSCDRLPLVVELFEENAGILHDKAAVICRDVKMSYLELNRISNQIAFFLREHKITPNNIVGIRMKPSERLVATILGVLKSGAAYLPLDYDYPLERIKFCLVDSGASLLIDEDSTKNILDDIFIFTYEELTSEIISLPSHNLKVVNSHEDLAYVMYTSGTTGTPKGVLIQNGSISKYIHDSASILRIEKNDRVIQQSSISFDASVEEIFLALCFGATLLVVPNGGKDIDGMVDLIQRERATVVLPTPLVLNELNKEYYKLDSVRVLSSGGDRLLPAHIDNLIGKKELINVYGPTEGTVAVTYQKIKTIDDLQTIGKPFPGNKIYILDQSMNFVPIGVEGCIYIGGNCLAAGYRDSSEVGFVANPFDPRERLFKTGDIGKWNDKGQIIFIGRNDTQRKIRGHRVEIEEIQKLIESFPNVRGVHVGIFNIDRDEVLVAFVVGVTYADETGLRFKLQQFLPYFMLPNKFIFIEKFPLTPNGKIDYPTLENLCRKNNIRGRQAEPMNELERYIFDVWVDILENSNFGVNDNFFEVGGNSIKVLKLFRVIDAQHPNKLTVSQLFTFSTISGQAQIIAQSEILDNEPSFPAEINF